MRTIRAGLLALLILGAFTPSGGASASEASLVGPVWRWSRVLGIDPVEVAHPGRYTLELLPDGRYTVRADCNRASGSYTLDGDGLSFAPGPTTSAECGPDSHSDRFPACAGGGHRLGPGRRSAGPAAVEGQRLDGARRGESGRIAGDVVARSRGQQRQPGGRQRARRQLALRLLLSRRSARRVRGLQQLCRGL